jgi:hypothetical protein
MLQMPLLFCFAFFLLQISTCLSQPPEVLLFITCSDFPAAAASEHAKASEGSGGSAQGSCFLACPALQGRQQSRREEAAEARGRVDGARSRGGDRGIGGSKESVARLSLSAARLSLSTRQECAFRVAHTLVPTHTHTHTNHTHTCRPKVEFQTSCGYFEEAARDC